MKLEKPNYWRQEPLTQLLELTTGGDWGKDENFEDENFDLAYCIRGSEIKFWDEDKGKTASLRKIKKASIESRKLQVGDILVEISGGGPEQPVGRTILIDKAVFRFNPSVPKICTNFLRLIRPTNEIDSKYLNLYLKLFYYSGEIVKYQGGSNNLRNLKFPDFIKIEIPFPSLSEQQVIVSKIDELLSDLDNGKQQLLIAQQQLKVYRQSFLKWAFEGRFGFAQRPGESVKEGELPKDWKLKELSDVAEMCLGKMLDKTKNKGNYQFYLRNISVRWGNFDLSDLEMMRFEESEEERYGLMKGDLVICEGGEPGRCAIWKDEVQNMKIQKALHRVRVKETLSVKFLYYFLYYSGMSGLLEKYFTGTTIKHLTGRELKKIEIPLPSIVEQQFIVDELESKLTVCDKIEETINQSLQKSEILRQSILKKAFEGKLIP